MDEKTADTDHFHCCTGRIAGFFCCAESAAEEPADGEPAEWTVMFYLCGANLESKYGFATNTLEEIQQVSYPYNMIPIYTAETVSISDMMRDVGKVNILVETGGAKKWNTQIQDMEISVSALQRWCYDYIPLENGQRTNSFRLLDTLPLQSMGDPETLVDFIRWGAENCPARKYALVLWDHGGGALSLCCDELFQDDVMYLYELRQALADSGVCLDTVIIDACLMANIETACAISDYAHWMVASEETVPGDGSAVSSWLQELIRHPALDGEWLGRCVCDKTEEKYANMDNELAGPLLTWSVTDLTKVSRVAETLDRFFQQIGELLANNPAIGKLYARYLSQTDQYGDDLVEYSKTAHLYNIPVQINSDKAVLRCQQTVMTSDARGTELNYYVYGVWLGYDENSMLMSRSVKPISMLQGQEFRLLYPVAGKGGNRDSYLSGKEMLLGRALLVKEIPLPAGTYYLEYELTDIFMRTMILDRIELYWDGQKFVLPDRLIWEGSVQPSWSR